MPHALCDMIVLIPGILGTTLFKNGREVWGISGAAAINNILSLGNALQDLRLEQGIGHDDPKDGVRPGPPLPGLSLLPTFWKIDGYGNLADFLKQRLTLSHPTAERAGNFIEFGYDWRLSNQLTARRLADTVIPELERWRKQTNNPDAKLILICHSMGGLVARWFLEVMGYRNLARTLITIGTPYQGSVNALTALVNGITKIGYSVTELVRSFPSAYQLLPTYPCLNLGDGDFQTLGHTPLPNIATNSVKEGLAFHARIAANLQATSPYKTFAIKGIAQPTAQSALLRGNAIVPQFDYNGVDKGGDGTVARPSSHPPEWGNNDTAAAFVSQKHSVLQSTDSILQQMFGIVTADQLAGWMGANELSLDMPDIVSVHEPLRIVARSVAGDGTLPLAVTCVREDGKLAGESELMRPLGNASYEFEIRNLFPGAYRVTVDSAVPAIPVDAVSDWVIVWDDNAATKSIA